MKTSRREHAVSILRELRRLGFTQKQIAQELEVDPGSLSHLYSPERAIGDEFLSNLERFAVVAKRKRVTPFIKKLPMQVMETCNRDGVVVDAAMNAAILSALTDAIIDLCTNADNAVRLPPGIEGALVRFGNDRIGIYVIFVEYMLDRESRKRVAHELEHLAARLRAEGGSSGDEQPPESEF